MTPTPEMIALAAIAETAEKAADHVRKYDALKQAPSRFVWFIIGAVTASIGVYFL